MYEPRSCPSFVAASNGLPDKGEWRTHPSIGDVNGDGLGDIAALSRKGPGPQVFLGNGLGEWTEASEGLKYANGFSCGVGTRLADVNADGHLDLVVADHCEGVRVFLNDGTGRWSEASWGIPRNLEGFNDVDVADIDGDGRPDLLAVSAFNSGFLMLRGEASGAWTPLHETGLPRVGSGWQVRTIDVNGDGFLDVVSTFNPTGTVERAETAPPAKVWLLGADGLFRPSTGFPEDGRWFAAEPLQRPDGPPDLLFGLFGFKAGLYIYRSEDGEDWTELGRLDEPWFTERITGFTGLDVVDLDGDGCVDIVGYETRYRRVLVAMGDCEQRWHLCPIDTVPTPGLEAQGWGVVSADLNSDGLPDIVASFGTASQGAIRAWMQLPRGTGQGQTTAVSSQLRGSGTPEPEP